MTNIVDSRRRSELMAGIRGRDTAPDITIRRVAHRMDLRFRLHRIGPLGRLTRTGATGGQDSGSSSHGAAVILRQCDTET